MTLTFLSQNLYLRVEGIEAVYSNIKNEKEDVAGVVMVQKPQEKSR